MNSDDRWNLATRRGQKRIDTVILPEDVKKDFFDDIAEYLDPEAVTWYVEHDQLYHRGYLLYGAPGTGKTSLSLAAAGQFGLDVYAMNLSKVNDATLNDLMSKLPTRCILLLEDIDAIESAKSRENSDAGSSTSSSVTLSGLLNAIDGAGSVEGRALIMTTNHVDRLDPAVIRPGRVDKMVEFGLASREMLLGLFRYVYLPLSSKTERVVDKNEGVVNNQNAQDTQKHIQELAAIHSPRDAVENVISWVEKEGEGFIPLRRQTSTMNTKREEAVDVFVSMDDMQSWSTARCLPIEFLQRAQSGGQIIRRFGISYADREQQLDYGMASCSSRA
ncbi:hypothetical protein ACQRIU_002419 [Beauveria bassiana]